MIVGAHAAKVHGYLAGTDEQRAADINDFLRDRRVRGIFALRGGYGTPRILAAIDYRALKKDPKVISGFSDITALQLAIYKKCKLVTFSGPMPAVEFWEDPDPYTEENFWRLVTSNKKTGQLINPPGEALQVLKTGKTAGVLLGGNLSLVSCTVGTSFFPSMRNAVLVLEEVEEQPYRVDRMLAHLANAEILGRLNGLILGKFTACSPKDSKKPSLTLDQMFEHYAALVEGPVLANVQYGHIPRKLTIPFGLKARVDGSAGTIDLLEAVVD